MCPDGGGGDELLDSSDRTLGGGAGVWPHAGTPGHRGGVRESGVKGRARFRFMVMLGGGSDILGVVVVPCGGSSTRPELTGRVEQGAAQVLQQAQARQRSWSGRASRGMPGPGRPRPR
jgi:hypothetical protein